MRVRLLRLFAHSSMLPVFSNDIPIPHATTDSEILISTLNFALFRRFRVLKGIVLSERKEGKNPQTIKSPLDELWSSSGRDMARRN